MKRFKSAITGEFVTEEFAKENPDTTVEMNMDDSQEVIEKLQTDNAKLLEALKMSLRLNKAFGANSEWIEVQEIESLIQKMER